ncbi:spore germination protein GerPE [Paenibacillus flagellatus]|uniref:Spore germination protein GerPE n=1 Tax=Paenibacillus flagellatus TaxID=2211139 RepID=A0A2V5KL96_9BACL|nr:spore germination protein GerPE [Paenibacillus flagellatus]PYI55740.1 spore germination protein GerPE [Paenibacillus flagellatus]
MPRLSVVDDISVNEVTFSSTLLVGDIEDVKPRTMALAVQREVPTFRGDEGSFESFPIFKRPIPRPVPDEPVAMTINNARSLIRVGWVDVLSVSTSSLLQVGSSRSIDAETRTKHIRQLRSRSAPASP